MTVATVASRALAGIDAPEVTVEVHLGPGLPAFHIVGLPDAEVREARDRVRAALNHARFEFPARRITVIRDPVEAVRGAHAVYTDVWASMGQESEATERVRILAPYQVNEELLAQARPDAIFMHCLPAKRGQEVTDGVMESTRSAVFDQAENRLHTQKALLAMLLG